MEALALRKIICIWADTFFLKLLVSQLLKKIPVFYGTWSFIIMFKRAIFWVRRNKTTLYRHVCLEQILTLAFLRCVFLLVSFLQGILPKYFCIYSCIFNACHMTCASHRPWFDQSNTVCRGVQIMKLLIMQFSPAFCYFIPLRSTYSVLTLSPRSSLMWQTKCYTHTKL
jgi:hypothetical protein